jgi:hypothetical protein
MLAGNNVASSRTPSPAGPWGEDVGVKTVHKLELQALILRGEALDPKATLPLGTAHRVPGDEALGAGRY